MDGLEHFIRLARVGKRNRGASGGEKRAYKLAQCILDNVPGLDGQAINGLKMFIDGCSGSYSECDTLINGEPQRAK